MTEQLYSAKQVAKAIAHTGDEQEITQLIRKIRHWSASDVLEPVEGKSTGTGVSRKYDALQVYIAALVYEVTHYGVTVDMISGVGTWIEEALQFGENWEKAVNDEKDFIVTLTWADYGDGGCMFAPLRENGDYPVTTEYQQRLNQRLPSSILVNLRTVFSTVTL